LRRVFGLTRRGSVGLVVELSFGLVLRSFHLRKWLSLEEGIPYSYPAKSSDTTSA
jgi:hypothetical protein